MSSFKNAYQLENWLNHNGINTDSWGEGTSKTAVDLWQELNQGDARLQGPPPVRLVRVVQVIIRQKNKVLIEIEQELGDGRIRQRQQYPADKMKPEENPSQAACRCLQEELNLQPNQITALSDPQEREETFESPSYPGLKTRFHFYEIEAEVTGLPDNNFWCENKAFASGDPVKRHHWHWLVP